MQVLSGRIQWLPSSKLLHTPLNKSIRVILLWFVILVTALRASAQSPTFGADAQHTGVYTVPAQPLNRIRWTTNINFDNAGGAAHYGAPLITLSNTVLVPARITNGFQVTAFEGATGRAKYTLSTDYIRPPLPTNAWLIVYQPVIALPLSGSRLYYPGAGGTVYYIENLDSDSPSVPVQQCFYTNLAGYNSNKTAFNNSVFINTPITAATNGAVYFGFRGSTTIAPPPISSTNSGFARLDPAGNGNFVLAGAAANDS